MKQDQTNMTDFAAQIQEKEDFFRSNFELNIRMTGLKASDKYCMESQNKGEMLSEMAKDKPLLIYRFTGSNCKTCYTDVFIELQDEISDNYILSHLIALCSNLTEREILRLKKTYKIQFPIYLIIPDSFDWILENENVPYFFVLHPNMNISHIYMPNKAYPKLNRQYLEEILTHLAAGR